MQFAENVADVPFDGVFTDHQPRDNLLIAQAIGAHLEYLQLTLSQFGAGVGSYIFRRHTLDLLYNTRRDARVQRCFSPCSPTHRLGQVVHLHTLEQI